MELKANSKSYIIASSELYTGTVDLKYMIRSELRGDGKTTLFFLGIPNPALVYVNRSNILPAEIRESLYQSAVNSIAGFITNEKWLEGNTYYGEYQTDKSFKISLNKPKWEDSNWGQKIDF